MKQVMVSQATRHSDLGATVEACPYLNNCSQEVNPQILALRCSNEYERCIIYQRHRILEKNRSLTGLQRFQRKYKDFDYGRQLGL